jgi:signal transduction histidine kinase
MFARHLCPPLFLLLALAASSVTLLEAPLDAQTITATIGAVSGIVTDSAKAVVPGMAVRLSGPSLMTTRIMLTGEAGAYGFSAVPPGDLVPTRTPNRAAFEWLELKRIGIDEAHLPSSATVVNHQLGLWQLYKGTILATGAVLLGQFLLIGGLLVQRRRRRRAQIGLRDLGGRLIAAQEAERARIARDLHDDVSQQLAALSIALGGLKRRAAAVPDSTDLQDDVASLQQRMSTLAESVRDLSHDLHPDVLRHLGLSASLTAYCNGLSRSPALEVGCSAEGDFESIAPHAALGLYRITQEALHNVVKHAQARQASVRLLRTGGTAEITISDDGTGFDIRSASNSGGIGLVSITERARLLGGTVSIVTTLNKGTQVRVRIPIDAHTAADTGELSGRWVTSA